MNLCYYFGDFAPNCIKLFWFKSKNKDNGAILFTGQYKMISTHFEGLDADDISRSVNNCAIPSWSASWCFLVDLFNNQIPEFDMILEYSMSIQFNILIQTCSFQFLQSLLWCLGSFSKTKFLYRRRSFFTVLRILSHIPRDMV